jgi:hypothetical protein
MALKLPLRPNPGIIGVSKLKGEEMVYNIFHLSKCKLSRPSTYYFSFGSASCTAKVTSACFIIVGMCPLLQRGG